MSDGTTIKFPSWKEVLMWLAGLLIGFFVGVIVLIYMLSWVSSAFETAAQLLDTIFVITVLIAIYLIMGILCKYTIQNFMRGLIIGIILAEVVRYLETAGVIDLANVFPW